LISRSQTRPQANLYGFNVRDAIPTFTLPLQHQDIEPIIDLHALLDMVYDRAGYAFAIDYNQKAVPSLSDADQAWSDQTMQSA
jgi:Protein of unknown function (DUF4058)